MGLRGLRTASALVLSALALGSVLNESAPAEASAATSCRARDVTQGTPARTDLQAVINAASDGDRIAVSSVCHGHFKILDKQLTLMGRSTPDHPRAVLDADTKGRALVANAQVKLINLKITGGDVVYPRSGAGIVNHGTLTLKDTVVSGNIARAGDLGDESPGKCGGIDNTRGTLVLVGASSVRKNQAATSGGGICGGTVTLNDSSSVTDNTSGQWGGGFEGGLVTMNDSSSVRGNTGEWSGGGIDSGFEIAMNGSSSVRGNVGGGIEAYSVTMNGSSSVRGNTGDSGGGIFAVAGLTMNDSAEVRGNAGTVGGGIYGGFVDGTAIVMNGSSSVRGNRATGSGGGIFLLSLNSPGTLTMNDTASMNGNRADFDNDGNGTGGGVFAQCSGILTGVVDGGNVNNNYLGSSGTDENDIDNDC